MGKRGRKPLTDGAETEPVSSFDDLPDGGVVDRDQLENWLAEANPENLDTTVTLYRKDPVRGDKHVVQQWTNYLPSINDVGMQFGSGRYILYVSFPQGKDQLRGVKTVTWNIDKNYDRLRVEAGIVDHAPGVPPIIRVNSPTPGGSSIGEMLTLIQAIVNMIAPLVKGGGNQASVQPEMIAASYKLMGAAMRESFVEQARAMNQLLLESRTGQVQDVGEYDDRPTWLEQITPLLEQIIPAILGRGAKSDLAVASVKALPQYQQLVNDQKKLTRLVSEAKKRFPKEQVDEVMKKLGIGGGE